MAMQSGGAAKHGVIQSSIALLQERFRQLQREKEMRQTKQLLRNNNFLISSSPPPSSSSDDSDSEPGNNDQFKLMFADEVAAVRRPELSLSLWPGGSSESCYAAVNGGGRGDNAAAVVKEGNKLYSTSYGFLGWDVKCDDDSRVSDVDTSLHL